LELAEEVAEIAIGCAWRPPPPEAPTMQ